MCCFFLVWFSVVQIAFQTNTSLWYNTKLKAPTCFNYMECIKERSDVDPFLLIEDSKDVLSKIDMTHVGPTYALTTMLL